VSTVGFSEAQQAFQGRGLPGPVRPQQSEDFAGLHGKAHASHRFGAAVAFAQIAHDDVIGHGVKMASAGIQRHRRLLQLQLAGIPHSPGRPWLPAVTRRGVNRARNRRIYLLNHASRRVVWALARMWFREIPGRIIPSQIKLSKIPIGGISSRIFAPGARVQRNQTSTKYGFGHVLTPSNVTDSSHNLLTALIPL